MMKFMGMLMTDITTYSAAWGRPTTKISLVNLMLGAMSLTRSVTYIPLPLL